MNILEKIHSYKERAYNWMSERAEGKHAKRWLAVFAFTESSFFPVPPDVLLVGMIALGAKKWKELAWITAIASLLGGMLGYLIGVVFFDAIGVGLVEFYHLQEELEIVRGHFEKNAFLAIFVSAFTFIPYKIFTIAAGLFKINFWSFVLGSALGRGLRFFLVAYITKLFGKRVLDTALKYFNIASALLIILIVVWVIFK